MVTIKSLLEAGVHFGHQTNRWNPKMKRYIFGEKNGIYIIDLQITLQCFQKAYEFTRDTVAAGESVLFVGTKRQAMGIVEEEADETLFWLEVIEEVEIFNKDSISDLMRECNEILSIVVASINTARKGK